MIMRWMPRAGISLLAACAAGAAVAQPAPPAATKATAAVDPASVPMPKLAFTPDAEIERNYFKYFFFHRDGTDFATAYADLQECDGYARGLSHRTRALSLCRHHRRRDRGRDRERHRRCHYRLG
jgi:hypothetical protein